MDKDELKIILNNHAVWLKDNETGKRANLQGAYLRYADLQGAKIKLGNREITL